MNAFRCSMVKKAFEKLDADRNGHLDIQDIKQFYDASRHPDVKAGKITADQALDNFLETFEAHRGLSKGDEQSIKGDKKVTLNEFQDYYSNVSASIDDDAYFELMIKNAWNLDNKKYGKAWGGEF